MPLSVDIYTGENHVGTIILEKSGKLVIHPSGSRLMQNILKEPIFTSVDGKLTDLHAQDNPQAFIQGLFTHYKSQGLRASKAQEVGEEAPPDKSLKK